MLLYVCSSPNGMSFRASFDHSGGKTMDTFNLFVIGAGQGGLPAAHMAARLGAKVALIEMGEVGGT